MGISTIIKGASKLKSANGILETVKEVETNAKSVKGTFKNAKNISAIVPADPLTKIVIFILLVIIPLSIFVMCVIAFIVLLAGVTTMIITKDPAITYDDSDKKTTESSSSSSNDLSIPDSVKGKFLIPWGISNVTNCYHCSRDSYGFHRGMDFQYSPKSWADGYDKQVYPIYPGEVVKADNVGHWSWGHGVIIKHTLDDGKTYYTLSAHMMDVKVKVGDKVGFDTALGTIGNTGSTSGSGKAWCQAGCGVHLHLELLNGAGYSQSGTSSSNLLPLYQYITCSSNGKALMNTTGASSATACENYRKEKLGKYPWK